MFARQKWEKPHQQPKQQTRTIYVYQILHIVAMLSAQRMGMPVSPLKCMLNVLQTSAHKI
jgi:hypothetical protein